MRVGTLRSQACQRGGLLTRWHGWCMVAWLSCDDHVILEGCYISEVVMGGSTWSSGHRLGCNKVRSKGSSWVWSEPIYEAWGLLNEVGEVNPAKVRGSMGLSIGNRSWHIYRKRLPSECNQTCLNAWDICPGLWWYNTPLSICAKLL